MPTACPHCHAPRPDTASECPRCGRPTSTSHRERGAKGWWSIQLKAPLWLVVSTILLLWGLGVFGGGEHRGKGGVVLIALGAFGVLASLAAIAFGRIRSRRESS